MYRKILLAVDGSRSADLALTEAARIAKAMGAEVEVLFVADDSDVFLGAPHFDPTKLRQGIVALGHRTLRAAGETLEAEGVRATTRLLEQPVAPGKFAATIVAEADRWGADLIAMGTHGRRGINRVVMGSVSEGVIRATTTPVLLTRAPGEE
ncbi:universal stress protein [Cupriavidus respiraculi]|uniref:Universal stress protein n=1 Tax=Cupriavidus respiraculi TaxID=195930 RepID=A0ABN7Y038_9BURK|nr:universal stress protein [Cupriavidus respiraculi]MBY4947896.1 universal stress protein [Cupriavidus respiraculi]CAG9166588.1 Putative universal stress protein [Cupriavidus respiraculi]